MSSLFETINLLLEYSLTLNFFVPEDLAAERGGNELQQRQLAARSAAIGAGAIAPAAIGPAEPNLSPVWRSPERLTSGPTMPVATFALSRPWDSSVQHQREHLHRLAHAFARNKQRPRYAMAGCSTAVLCCLARPRH